jgi:hypothetical protein
MNTSVFLQDAETFCIAKSQAAEAGHAYETNWFSFKWAGNEVTFFFNDLTSMAAFTRQASNAVGKAIDERVARLEERAADINDDLEDAEVL